MKYNVKKKVGLCIFHLILVGILIHFDMSIALLKNSQGMMGGGGLLNRKNTLNVCDSYLSTHSQQLSIAASYCY